MEYRIEHVRDFLNVPEDRLDECLEEFKTFIQIARANEALFIEVAKAIDPDFHEETLNASIRAGIGAYRWIDDGKRDITIHLTTEPQETPQ